MKQGLNELFRKTKDISRNPKSLLDGWDRGISGFLWFPWSS